MKKTDDNVKFKFNVGLKNPELAGLFSDISLLENALTHSSFHAANAEHVQGAVCDLAQNGINNERLEFLGDAVLDLVISELLFSRIAANEGDLSKLRAQIVCEHSLSLIARKQHIGDFLILGRSVEQSGGRQSPSILSDALEAVIGALFVDSGYDICREFVLKIFDATIKSAIAGELFTDFKSEFQEYVQSSGKDAKDHIAYRLVDSKGPEHSKIFFVELLLDGKSVGSGSGKTKKEAEQHAAQAALLNLRNM